MIPFKVTSRDIDVSDSMVATIEDGLSRLDAFEAQIRYCEIVLSKPHCHHRKIGVHHVHLHIKTSHGDLYIDRELEKDLSHAEFRRATADAFATARARLRSKFSKLHRAEKGRHHGLAEDVQLTEQKANG